MAHINQNSGIKFKFRWGDGISTPGVRNEDFCSGGKGVKMFQLFLGGGRCDERRGQR